MFISRLTFKLQHYPVQRLLASPYELHRTLLAAFPHIQTPPNQNLGTAHRVLYRLENSTVLLQSLDQPDWQAWLTERYSYLTQLPLSKPFNPSFQAQQTLRFRLTANPTQAKSAANRDKRSQRLALYQPAEQLTWLHKKAHTHGFTVLQVDIQPGDKLVDRRTNLSIFSVQFDGLLQVTDPHALLTAVAHGIGAAKAFGCGLLSLAPT